uniref:Uncharacterized protein n=1 Tax=Rhizophora mucronata TaxID=61149 RepID=A0A2P2JNQ4_RHIMU
MPSTGSSQSSRTSASSSASPTTSSDQPQQGNTGLLVSSPATEFMRIINNFSGFVLLRLPALHRS